MNDPNAPQSQQYSQQSYQQPPPPNFGPGAKPKSSAAPWLIGCAVVAGLGVVIVGILAVLGIYGTRKYIANAKTAEARNNLGQIAKDAVAAYDADSLGALAPPTAKPTHHLCPSATRTVPTDIRLVSGKKYMSSPSEWDVDAASDAGFACLKFEMSEPQYFMYSYESQAPGTTVGNGFSASAKGDLNGDGITSSFTIEGRITAADTLSVSPNLVEVNPGE